MNAVYNALDPQQNIRRMIDEGIFTPLDLALLFTGRQEPTTTPMPGIANYLSSNEPSWAKAMRYNEMKAYFRKESNANNDYKTVKETNSKKLPTTVLPAVPPTPSPAPLPPIVSSPPSTTTAKPETTTKSLCQLLSESKFRIFLGEHGGMRCR